MRLQVVADQVESKELQESLARLICVQLSGAAGRQVSGMGIGFLQTGIEQIEVFPGDDAFTPDLDGIQNGYGERDIQVSTDRVGHILADDALPAAGNGLLQLTILIAQHDGQSIQLPGDQDRRNLCEGDQIFDRLGLLGREHGLGVPDGNQFLQDLAGYLLGGRSGENQTSFGLKAQQLLSQPIIFLIGHDGVVIPVVGNISRLQLTDQRLHALNRFFIHTHSCVPPFL